MLDSLDNCIVSSSFFSDPYAYACAQKKRACFLRADNNRTRFSYYVLATGSICANKWDTVTDKTSLMRANVVARVSVSCSRVRLCGRARLCPNALVCDCWGIVHVESLADIDKMNPSSASSGGGNGLIIGDSIGEMLCTY